MPEPLHASLLRPSTRRHPLAPALAALAALSLAGASSGVAVRAQSRPSGTIPNRSYPAAELHRQISPDLSPGVNHNQSSVVDGRLFISGNGHQELWNIADPYAPVLVSQMDSPFANGEAEGHQMSFARIPDGQGGFRHCAVTVSGRGIDFWDLTAPQQPMLLHAMPLSGIHYGDNTEAVWGLAWQGHVVWVGGTNTGIHVVDATDPANPRLLRRIPTSAFGGVSAGPLWALGNLLVVTTPKGSAGVATLDISEPRDPIPLDSVRPSTGRSSYIGGFFGGHAFLQSPFRTYDVTTDPRAIRLLGSSTTPRSEYMAFGNGRLYLGSLRLSAGGVSGVLEYDISDPNALVQLAHVPGRPNREADDQFPLPIGNLLVLGDEQAAGVRGSFLAPIATSPDAAPPRILVVDPADGATGQSPTTRIGLSFDDQIELATLDDRSLVVRPVGGNPVPGRWSINHTVVSFSPDAPLTPHTTYEIVVPGGGITDLVGNPVATTFRSTFRTGAVPAPPDCRIAPVSPVETGSATIFRLAFPDPARLEYTWDVGDGSPPLAGPEVTHTYNDPGRYAVRVEARDRDAATWQAEHARLEGGVVTATNNAGYRGTSFVDFPGGQGLGVRTTFVVDTPAFGLHDVLLRFAMGASTTRRLGLWVNGTRYRTLDFDPTGSWTSWSTVTLTNIPLRAGHNEIAFVADAGTVGPNLDDLTVLGLGEVAHDAAHGVLDGGVTASTARAGHLGDGYAAFPANATGRNVALAVGFVASRDGAHDLGLRFGAAAAGTYRLNLYVDGRRDRTLVLAVPTPGAWSQTAVADVDLVAGTNRIELVADAGTPGPDVDGLDVVPPAAGVRGCTVTQIVHRPLPPAGQRPTASSGLWIDELFQRAWAVQSDGDTVSLVDLNAPSVTAVRTVGRQPTALAAVPRRAEVWVANRGSHDLTILRSTDAAVLGTVALPYASQPTGIVFTPDGTTGFVALEALGRLVRIDPATRTVTGSLDLAGAAVRGLAVAADGRTLWAPRMLSPTGRGEVFEVDVASFTLRRTIALPLDPGPDTPDSGRGVPNHVRAVAISPDGVDAWLVAKKDNVLRGTFRDGQALGHDNTVRPILCRLDLAAAGGAPAEDLAARVDLNDADSPSAVATSPLGDLVFVALQGNNQVDVRDAYTGETVASLSTGRAPQAVAVDARGRLVTLDFLGRGVTVFDVAALLDGTDTAGRHVATVPWTVREPLAPDVLRGKRIFYNAADARMAFEGYMSCATCHLDGTQDARVWDVTDRGEGLRNTTTLRGRGGLRHGPVHWTGNFDEIQDFENDIRTAFGGTGFLSDPQFFAGSRRDPLGEPKAGLDPDLDALATYVHSLEQVPPSPWRRADGTLTAAGRQGRVLYDALGCASCHTGAERTDSALGRFHDVGTIQPHSGNRRGQPLTGLDTPTLKGVWATGPWLHDGSAPTLQQVVANPLHGNTASLTSTQRDLLAEYLLQIDETVDLSRGERFRASAEHAGIPSGSARVVVGDAARGLWIPPGTRGGVEWRVGLEAAATSATVELVVTADAAPAALLTVDGVPVEKADASESGRGTADAPARLVFEGVRLRAGTNRLLFEFGAASPHRGVLVRRLEVR